MLPKKLDAGDQIVVRQRDGIGTGRCLATEGRIQRGCRRPRFQPTGAGIGVCRNEAAAQDDVAGYQRDDDCQYDSKHEPSEHHDLL